MWLRGTYREKEKDWNNGPVLLLFRAVLGGSASSNFKGRDLPHALAPFKPHSYGA